MEHKIAETNARIDVADVLRAVSYTHLGLRLNELKTKAQDKINALKELFESQDNDCLLYTSDTHNYIEFASSRLYFFC